MKTTEQFFKDWESYIFGFGYGTGEEYTLKSLKDFFAAIPEDDNYDYRNLEAAVGGPIAWLLINILAHDDKIEYGGSPRFGWLTKSGKALREFLNGHSLEQLYELTNLDNNYQHCFPDYCNHEENCMYHNPFWKCKRK